MRRLFPEVPADHPAMGSMTLNIAANALGLSNAATPLGLRAMEDLERLNPAPGVATNAMCTFLTINTAGVQIIPASMISIMAGAGSKDPSAIIGTTFAATLISLVLGLAMVKLLERLPWFSVERSAREPGP
jgi:spore maturation protein A